jgi:guanidinopropionase
MTTLTLDKLRAKYGDADGGAVHDPEFRKVAERIFSPSGQRSFPYSGIPTFLRAPLRSLDWSAPNLEGLDVALLGIPMDLGVTNRNGARFGPRALRAIERIGPYNHVLKCMPTHDLAVADIGDLPLSSRFDLEKSHADIFRHARILVDAGVKPVSVGGDHSITLPLLKAVAKDGPVGLIATRAAPSRGANSITAARSVAPCSTARSTRAEPSRSAFGARPNICGSSPMIRA